MSNETDSSRPKSTSSSKGCMETNTTLKIIVIVVSCILLIVLIGVLVGVFAIGCPRGYTSHGNNGECDRCAVGYHRENEDCKSGECLKTGTFYKKRDGSCECKPKFVGGMCDQCVSGYEGDKCNNCAVGYHRNKKTCEGNELCSFAAFHYNSQNGRFAACSPFGRSLAPGLDQILKRTPFALSNLRIFAFSNFPIFSNIPIFL